MKHSSAHQKSKALAITSGALLFIVLLFAWYAISTRIAAASLVDDIVTGDVAGIMEKVDMESLRKDAKSGAAASLKQNMSDTGVISFNHDVLADLLVGKQIDETYSAKGAARIIADKRTPYSAEDVEYKITRKGMNRFDVHVKRPIVVDLIFYRHGFQWKLSAIRNLGEKPVKNYASNESVLPSL